MIALKAAFTIWQREIIRYLRDRSRIATSLIQPVMFFIVFGSGFRRILAQGNFGVDYIQFIFPGIIAMSVMGTAFFSTISTVWDREFGFLKEILVAPVPRTGIAFGKALGATTIASFQALILLVIGPFIGLTMNLVTFLKLFPVMLLLAFTISGLGLLIASLMKTTESFGLIMQLLIFPMFFLSGAFFPLTSAPDWMKFLSAINPLTYGVDSMRQLLLETEVPKSIVDKFVLHPIHTDVAFLLGISAMLIGAAVYAFNRN